MQKDLMPDEHDGEKVKEELDGGARSAQDRQQVYNKAWLRRTREAAHKQAVRRDRARAPCRQSHTVKWTLLPFCEMGQTFTVLIKI